MYFFLIFYKINFLGMDVCLDLAGIFNLFFLLFSMNDSISIPIITNSIVYS